jgi:hypothetical protein
MMVENCQKVNFHHNWCIFFNFLDCGGIMQLYPSISTEVLKVQCSAKLAAQVLLRHLAHAWHMKPSDGFQFAQPILRCPNKNG